MLEERYLGGESTHRSMLVGGSNRPRKMGLITVGILGVFVISQFQLPGLAMTVLAGAVVFLLTIQTRRGSILHRFRNKRRWKERTKDGTLLFRRVSTRPESLTEMSKTADRAAMKDITRTWNTYRDFPDGVDGFGWLQKEPGRPGIAYHEPVGEAPWLTVVWSVEGQIRGLDGDDRLQAAMEAWGVFISRYGSMNRLPSRVQVLTRVLPWDSAPHYAWIGERLPNDNEAIEDLLAESYVDVMRQVASIGLVQRHFVVMRWPINAHFNSEAAKYGPGYEGWRKLMDIEIAAVSSSLAQARLGDTMVLSAPRVAGVLRHLQLPCWPVDNLANLDVDEPWVDSVDEWSAVWNIGDGPDGEQHLWAHRTAEIPVDALATGGRTVAWIAPLLGQLSDRVVRTVSFQVEIRHASDARSQARTDATQDSANLISQQRKGQMTDDQTEAGLAAAQQRLADLRPGSGIHGAGWAAHVTVSAPNEDGLRNAVRAITDAAHSCGVEHLEWLDTQQGAAAAATWPLARGMKPIPESMTSMLRSQLAGRASTREMSS